MESLLILNHKLTLDKMQTSVNTDLFNLLTFNLSTLSCMYVCLY